MARASSRSLFFGVVMAPCIHKLLHHRWNRLHHRWCVLHHQRNTGPYSLLSYSYNYNPDCPSAISLDLDQP
jgi:hypothetical protein